MVAAWTGVMDWNPSSSSVRFTVAPSGLASVFSISDHAPAVAIDVAWLRRDGLRPKLLKKFAARFSHALRWLHSSALLGQTIDAMRQAGLREFIGRSILCQPGPGQPQSSLLGRR